MLLNIAACFKLKKKNRLNDLICNTNFRHLYQAVIILNTGQQS